MYDSGGRSNFHRGWDLTSDPTLSTFIAQAVDHGVKQCVRLGPMHHSVILSCVQRILAKRGDIDRATKHALPQFGTSYRKFQNRPICSGFPREGHPCPHFALLRLSLTFNNVWSWQAYGIALTCEILDRVMRDVQACVRVSVLGPLRCYRFIKYCQALEGVGGANR